MASQEPNPGYGPIMTSDAKCRGESHEYTATPSRHPADVPPRLAARLRSLAIRAFRLLGCRDYARIDFRVSPAGKPYILEVNPNPALNPSPALTLPLQPAACPPPPFTIQPL